jgi:aldose 1-epimerase
MVSPNISRREFGQLPDGRPVHEYTLDNGAGLVLSAITYGGIVTALWLPDGAGQRANVVLGFDNLRDYLERNPHFGVIVGRFGNRIAQGRFTLDGHCHQLDLNDGPNCLHGGTSGFGTQLWEAEIEPAGTAGQCPALLLRYTSPDGEGGFPGTMAVTVRYSLTADQTWRIDYEARCDKPTVVNLTHHDYFNLAGRGSAMGQRLMIAASRYTEVDGVRIPTGIASVEGTPFDFRRPAVIEPRLRETHPQLLSARGFDHNWLLDHSFDGGLHLAASLEDPQSGRKMEIHSSEPALQFYSGNFLDASLIGSGGEAYRQGDGLCLETQHSPDSPNHPAGQQSSEADWPSTVLRPGEVYRSCAEHRFGLACAGDSA